MSEKGFFTIVALGLLLLITISIKTVQESETNYSYGATNFQMESELQNAADGGIFEAAEKIQNGSVIIPKPVLPYARRKEIQHKISVTQPEKPDDLKNISLEVYAERGTIERYRRISSKEDDEAVKLGVRGYKDKNLNFDKPGVILISVASGEMKANGIKKFRRSIAYILDDEKNIIYFMNSAERGLLNP